MTKFNNIKIRNYAELVNIITQANKSGLMVYSLLLKDMFVGDCLFSIKIIYKNNTEDNKNMFYIGLIQFLFNSVVNNNIKHICIFADCYDVYFKSNRGFEND